MKKTILFLILILSYSVYSQTLRGIYLMQSLEGVGDNTKLTEKAEEILIYEYTYSGSRSSQVLITPGGTTTDTILKRDEKYGISYQHTSTTILLNKSVIIKDFKRNQIERNFGSTERETFIVDKIPTYDWKISDEKKIIQGYTCRKATAETVKDGYSKVTIAWFCEDIPISDGPLTLNGLPGFIFEAYSGNLFKLEFKNFSLNKNEIVVIESIKSDLKPKTNQEFENEIRRK